MGAILRTAAAVGVIGIVLPQTVQFPINSDDQDLFWRCFFGSIGQSKSPQRCTFLLQANEIKTLAVSEKAEKTAYEYSLRILLP